MSIPNSSDIEVLRPRKKIEPILNTRMKNLSNFSLRYKDREAVIEQKSYSCRAKRLICNSVYVSVATITLILVLFLLFNRPDSYGAVYETVFMSDREPEARPKIGFCMSMPFMASKLRELRIPSHLASFLLYSLSPFFPNREILEDQELLTELTAQYRRLVSRYTHVLL